MYETSKEYKASLDKGWLDTDVRGTISLSNGVVIPFEEKDIVPGTLSFTNKAVNGNDFCFGGIYVGELTVDLMKRIDRYSLQDAKVEVTYIHRTAEGIVDEIPIGIFYVYEATRTKRILSLKAYDSMTNFDKEVEETTTGTLYDILDFISEKCEVPLAHTEEEINAFVNADWWLTLDMELIATYREALSSIGLLCGRFATINRLGELEFRTFQTKAQESISARRRTESTIADFMTYFCGVKARFFARENYYPYTALDETMDTGLILNLGDIAIFQGEDTSKRLIMDNLLKEALEIKYVPVELSMLSDPSIDLGDCVELKCVNNSEESVVTLIHSVSWTYHSKQKLASYGSNPKLKGIVSKEDKLLAQMESQLSSKNLVVKTYTNSRKIVVNNLKEQEVFAFNFAATEKTTVMFMGIVPFESSLDGMITFRTYLDGVLDDTAIVSSYFDRGSHVVSLTNYFPMAANGRATLKITAMTEYFESDIRRNNADIVSLLDYVKNQSITTNDKGVPYLSKTYEQKGIDVTPPTTTIKKSTIKGVLFAQGIAGAGQWDGTINIAEEFSPVSLDTMIPFGALVIGKFRDLCTVNSKLVKQTRLDETFVAVHKIDEIGVERISEDTSFSREEVPHGDGDEIFVPVSLDGRFVLDFMKTSLITNLDEGGD